MDGTSDNSGWTASHLDAKFVVLAKLEKLRNNSRGRKVQELISLDEDGAQLAQ